jgi:integrase
MRTPWIFHHPLARRNHQPGERLGSLRNSFKAAAKRAKLPPEFRQHDLRHRRVTTWLAEGHGTALVQEAMGHSSPQVTQRYTHLQPVHLQALVEENRPKNRPKEGIQGTA